MRRVPFTRRVVIAAAIGLAAPVAAVAAPAEAAPYCGITWGSLAKAQAGVTQGNIVGVRAGQHSCYDRIVIDVRGDLRGWSVRYVDQVVGPGSGLPVPLAGGARLEVLVESPTYDHLGRPTLVVRNPARVVDVTGYPTLRQVALAGSFEGQTTFGVGVRARLPFRAFTLPGTATTPERLVIDVAHRW